MTTGSRSDVRGEAPSDRAGRVVPALLPDDPAWLTAMTASKIAAVVGLSPWESRFSLWHRMAGLLEREAEKPQHRRGHYLEPAVAAWFADQHPELVVSPSPSWQHRTNPLWVATPDRLLTSHDDEWSLEVKTAADFEDWGPAGTDQIPPHYAAQAQWQMLCSGHQVTHVAVLTAYLEFREYVLPASPLDQAYLATKATEFLDSLPGGPLERRPDLDNHDATYQAVRAQHPDIAKDEVAEIPDEIGTRYRLAVPAAKTAADELVGAKTALLDAMGDARKAEHDGQQIARRQSGARGAVALHSTIPKEAA